MDVPRAILNLNPGTAQELRIKVWCIQDLIPPESSSSSEEKHGALVPVIKADNPELIIAVGTAGYPSATSFNGSVIIGANFFIHDGHPGNQWSNLKHPDIGKLQISNVNSELFGLVNREFRNSVEPKLISPPREPAEPPVCLASKAYTAISTINVTDYTEYNWVDDEAVTHFRKESKLPVSSLETTHGVIKLCSDRSIIFISAITDRIGYFDSEVNPTQNYVASFNAGIVLGQLLISLNEFYLTGKSFS